MEVSSFAEIEEEFMRRVQRTVWCTVATVDSKGRPQDLQDVIILRRMLEKG